MNKIKTYKEFSVNEELTRDQRTYLLLPWALISKAGQKLFDIYPFLNLRWSEMKKTTKDSKFDSIFGGGSNSKIEDNLTKINKSDLPKSLKWGMLLRSWNIYLTDKKTSSEGRPVIYISKEELSKGDTCIFDRLNDRDVYPEKDKSLRQGEKIEEPVIIMVAKYSDVELFDDMKETIEDIWLEMQDEFPIKAEPSFNLQGDVLYINLNLGQSVFRFNKGFGENIRNEKLIKMLEESSQRTKEFLENEGFNLDYEIKFKIGYHLIYKGNKGRFGTEIIPAAKEYAIRYDSDVYDNFHKMLRVDLLGLRDDKLSLGVEDIETLLSDMDNCYNTDRFDFVEMRPEENKSNGVVITNISIKFKKR